MTAVIAWVIAPVLWSLLSLGLGCMLQGVIRGRIPTGLLLPIGFAVLVVLGTITTAWPPTAMLTMPLVVVLALLGLYLQRARLRPSSAAWPPTIAAIGTYVLYGLPVMISGAPFAGWIKLDDGASWLAFTDQLMANGRTTEGLAPSTFETLLRINWEDSAYPLGVFAPLGGVANLTHVDPAWLLQPYLAFLAGVLALVIHHVLRRYVTASALRVVLVVLAATPALLLGYALWGGIKELALAPMFVVIALLAVRRYSAAALATVAAAVLAVAGFSGLAWLIVPGLFWLVGTIRGRQWRSLAVAALGTVALSLPLLVLVRPADIRNLAGFAASSNDIGNLIEPLQIIQIFGIWPVDDFRFSPEPMAVVSALLVVVAALAGLGLWHTFTRRDWVLGLYVGNCLLITAVSSPGNAWIAGKALAMSSPALLVAAAAGIGWLWEKQRTVIATAALALMTFGVGWSYVLAYQGVWLAPASQVRDLQAIGEQDLPKPALIVDYSPYGARHFLRRLDAEGAGELRRRTIPKASGGQVWKAEYAQIDDISQAGLADFETLVLRSSAIGSRPPSNYTLQWQGEAYEVWQRNPDAAPIVEHIPLGTETDPAEFVTCEQIRQIAAEHPEARIAAAERPPVISVWPPADSAAAAFTVPVAGEYDLSLGGSFTGELNLTIDGQEVFRQRHQLNWTGNVTPAGTVPLAAGRHELTVTERRPPWQPGNRNPGWPLGPLYLSLATADVPVIRVPSGEADQLCGRRLDWLEVLS